MAEALARRWLGLPTEERRREMLRALNTHPQVFAEALRILEELRATLISG